MGTLSQRLILCSNCYPLSADISSGDVLYHSGSESQTAIFDIVSLIVEEKMKVAGQCNYSKSFFLEAHITFTYILFTKESHMAKPNVGNGKHKAAMGREYFN